MSQQNQAPLHLPDLTTQAALELNEKYVSPQRVAAYRAYGLDLVQGRREGVRIWDLDGNSFINCRSSGGVFNFGHRPAFAIEALKQALDEIDMGDWLLLSQHRARAAQALAEVTPGDLQFTFFTASGAEAAEVAVKLARGVTKRPRIVCLENGYHGHVGFGLAMDDAIYNQWYHPLVPGVKRIPMNDIDAVDRAVDDQTAIVCMETIPATAGYIVPSKDYYEKVRRICDDRGALLMLDEVQCGGGRTGKIWAAEHWNVTPDLLMFGKSTSGGIYPISGCCYNQRVEDFLKEDPIFHPSSYSGAEPGAVLVQAVVNKLREPGFLEHVTEMSARFKAGFDRLCAEYPDKLKEHRGLGLMLALETHSEAQSFELMRGAVKNGILAIFANNRRTSLLIMPPLIISAQEVDEVLDGLEKATQTITA